MDLQSDDFALFGLPVRFAQDRGELELRWKDLQRQVHPDRFAADGAAAQRVAMQWSVRINEAYQRLKDPLRRAAYLCELRGVPIRAQDNTAMPADFLMQQIAWREALDEAQDGRTLASLAQDIEQAQQQALALLASLLDELDDVRGAAAQVRCLMFIDRLTQEVEDRLDRISA